MKHDKPICGSNIAKVNRHISNANIVFEIGAYDGVDIQEINQLWNNPIIHCFEPDTEPFEILNTYASEKIICNNIGLFDKEDKITLYKVLNKNLSEAEQKNRSLWYKTAQSLYPINTNYHGYPKDIGLQEVEINVSTIDNYCEKHNVIPNIILMDTQGSEYDILVGAQKILKNNNLKGIMLEWSTDTLYTGQKKLDDITTLLETAGFVLAEKINLWNTIHGDAIFIRK